MTDFNTKEELFKHLKDNKSLLIRAKKSAVKESDCIFGNPIQLNGLEKSTKSEKALIEMEPSDIEGLKARIVINSCNILDSHGDVHIKGLWNKSLKDSKEFFHIQEHLLKFENVISDGLDVKAFVQEITWSELGFNYSGKTECLIFDSIIREDRNEFMFDQYFKGFVRQHSVGMIYVTLLLCINSEDKYYREEKDNWDKYINIVVNKQDAIDQGYFWAVIEAKIIEGSAVVRGSNQATPTISITQLTPSDDTETKDSRESTVTIAEFKNEISNQFKNLKK